MKRFKSYRINFRKKYRSRQTIYCCFNSKWVVPSKRKGIRQHMINMIWSSTNYFKITIVFTN